MGVVWAEKKARASAMKSALVLAEALALLSGPEKVEGSGLV